HTDDVRRGRHRLADEGFGGLIQAALCLDPQVDEAGERQVDLADLVQVNLVADAAQLVELGFAQDLWHGLAEFAPLAPLELDEGRYSRVRGGALGRTIHDLIVPVWGEITQMC